MPRPHPRRFPGRAVPGLAVFAVCALAGAGPPAASPYAPYAFLIGQWDVAPESGGPPLGGALFRWGPKESYIWCAATIAAGGREIPHFEGLLMWNGVQKNLDVLIALDLEGGRIQEKGTLRVDADGTVVREITASYSEGVHPIGMPVAGAAGATARFRQTFQPDGPDRIRTRVLRETADGWVATFPGSDRLVMTRRKAPG
jgi:hypothetical protein